MVALADLTLITCVAGIEIVRNISTVRVFVRRGVRVVRIDDFATTGRHGAMIAFVPVAHQAANAVHEHPARHDADRSRGNRPEQA